MNIEEEWNKIAKDRLLDRLEGNDTSYNNVLLPTIYNRVKELKSSLSNILDFGCGTGELTYEISKLNVNIVGLDISKYSIKIAEEYFKSNNLHFIDKSLFDVEFDFQFNLVIANMSLMDTEDIESNFSKICSNLKEKGRILITITHPAFWPIYWNYYKDDGFDYLKELKITKTYKTSKTTFSGFNTSHYHRPISFYLKLFKENKMNLLDIKELKNPNDKLWYPRFLYFEIEK